eukprot:1277637-Amphidinium_carterae.1
MTCKSSRIGKSLGNTVLSGTPQHKPLHIYAAKPPSWLKNVVCPAVPLCAVYMFGCRRNVSGTDCNCRC